MPLGYRDLSTLVLHPGWDLTALQKFTLQDGVTFAAVVTEMQAVLAALNTEINSDPFFRSIASYTDELTVEYRQGSSRRGFIRHTEYGRPDPEYSGNVGHMLPLIPYDNALGWTWDSLRKARMSTIRQDLVEATRDARDLYRKAILQRLFKRGDDSGDLNGLGTTGYSPGFATAAASTNIDFTPPATGGTTFTSDHEHYVAIAGGVFTNDVFKDSKAELMEHGHQPPFNFAIGIEDESTVAALSDFVPRAKANISYGNGTTLATVDEDPDANGGYVIGVIHDHVIRVVRGIARYYGFGWKSYGPNSPRNPLRIRLQKGATRPEFIAMPDPRAGGGAYPLQYMMLFTELGIGVGDRTNGTARYVNNSSWDDGTPT